MKNSPSLSVILVFITLFSCSLLRHLFFRSESFDLGIFDQALWLISTGKVPYSTIINRHILGDHGAWILYLISIFYKIYPTVIWLFLLQSLSLAFAGALIFRIALSEGLEEKEAHFAQWAFYAHPMLFNVNLYDFHPETLAVTFLLIAYHAGLNNKFVRLSFFLLLALGCKEVIACAAIGLAVLFLLKRKFKSSLCTLLLSIGVGAVTIAYVIPTYNSGKYSSGFERYIGFGESPGEAIKHLINSPFEIGTSILGASLGLYILKLVLPSLCALHLRGLPVLLGALPIFILNSLSSFPAQRSITFQYSITILPVLALMVIESLKSQRPLIKSLRLRFSWIIICFFAPYLIKFSSGELDYPVAWFPDTHTIPVLREAVSLIPPKARVLAPSNVVPHLSHRVSIEFIRKTEHAPHLSKFDFVLLNDRSIGWQNSPALQQRIVSTLNQSVAQGTAQLLISRSGVRLYKLRRNKSKGLKRGKEQTKLAIQSVEQTLKFFEKMALTKSCTDRAALGIGHCKGNLLLKVSTHYKYFRYFIALEICSPSLSPTVAKTAVRNMSPGHSVKTGQIRPFTT